MEHDNFNFQFLYKINFLLQRIFGKSPVYPLSSANMGGLKKRGCCLRSPDPPVRANFRPSPRNAPWAVSVSLK